MQTENYKFRIQCRSSVIQTAVNPL